MRDTDERARNAFPATTKFTTESVKRHIARLKHAPGQSLKLRNPLAVLAIRQQIGIYEAVGVQELQLIFNRCKPLRVATAFC